MSLKDRIKRRREIIKSYIGWEDYLGGFIILLGVLGYFGGPIPYLGAISTFYHDLSTELIGIGIAVLIIDNANEMMKRREEKKRIILQMGSPDNGFAVEAVRQLSARRWLTDGRFMHHCHFGNLSLVVTHFQQGRKLVSLFPGKLCVGSHECSFDLVDREVLILPWLTSFFDHLSCTC